MMFTQQLRLRVYFAYANSLKSLLRLPCIPSGIFFFSLLSLCVCGCWRPNTSSLSTFAAAGLSWHRHFVIIPRSQGNLQVVKQLLACVHILLGAGQGRLGCMQLQEVHRIHPHMHEEHFRSQQSLLPRRQLIVAWVVLHILSSDVLLPILVVTFVASRRLRMKRHPTVVNNFIIWILSGWALLILWYSGYQFNEDPPAALCILQTSLINGLMPLWSFGALSLIYCAWTSYRPDPQKWRVTPVRLVFIIGVPYVVGICFAFATAILSIHDPSRVVRDPSFFYCVYDSRGLAYTLQILTIIVTFAALFLAIHLAISFIRNRRKIRKAGAGYNLNLKAYLIIRVLIFGIYMFFGAIISIMSFFTRSTFIIDIYVSTAGIALFIIFGSQPEVLRVWCFWRHYPDDEGNPSHPPMFVINTSLSDNSSVGEHMSHSLHNFKLLEDKVLDISRKHAPPDVALLYENDRLSIVSNMAPSRISIKSHITSPMPVLVR